MTAKTKTSPKKNVKAFKVPTKTPKKKAPAKKVTLKKPAPKPKRVKPEPKTKPIVTGAHLQIGFPAPPFKLPATDIGEVSLAKLKGKPFVLYFYPKDDTSGCTAEACGFRDAHMRFNDMGLTVIGVSKDSLDSHKKFKAKFDLDFPLASDESGVTCNDYGVWIEKSLYGRKYMGLDRATFLIDAQGIIRGLWRHVSVPGHVDKVRQAAQILINTH